MAVLSTTDVRALLAEHGLRPSRALGQNFLADPNTATRIARLAEVDSNDRVVEIGPGLGSLTLALAATGASVLAIEIDRRLVPVLESVVAEAPNVTVEQGDALGLDFATLLGSGEWSCVSNLPYNVATPVVVRLLDDVPQITRFLVMVQREVGERLAAAPGSRASGAVSVRVAFHAEARVVGAVPASVFVPRPKVESVLVRIDRRRAPPVTVSSPARMFELVRAGFAQRRKMLRRSLRPVLGDRVLDALAAAGIDPRARAETLDLEAWVALSEEAGS
ncbi:MAG TPA: 16S rRNA (adenine(1518)-N(6)/adenine(1519)-N(6))-dimethyltransferase RsmA [Acidimicrobiia bacterium]|jgi:16S rRNA (adenine1518-N6/adenine1519-N6)-dimethyltransferase